MKKSTRDVWVSGILPLALLILWDIGIRREWLPRTIIASPADVLKDFVRLLMNGTLLLHCKVSLERFLVGFFIGSLAGILFGMLVGMFKLGEHIIAPTIQLLSPIPPPAWIPLLIILFGIGSWSKILLIAIGVFFVVYINTVQGIRNVDLSLVEVAYVYRKSRTFILFNILTAGAVPSILTGLRVAAGLSWILLIAAEVISSSEGIGWLIWDSRNFSRPDDMITAMITMGILGKLTDILLVKIEEKALFWRSTFSGQ